VSKIIRLTMVIAKVGKRIAGKRDRRGEQEAPLAIMTACNTDWTRGRVNKKLLIAFLPRPPPCSNTATGGRTLAGP
jgi:hypothetical protein